MSDRVLSTLLTKYFWLVKQEYIFEVVVLEVCKISYSEVMVTTIESFR